MSKRKKQAKQAEANALRERWARLGVPAELIDQHTAHITKPPPPLERVRLEWWQRPDKYLQNGSERAGKDDDEAD